MREVSYLRSAKRHLFVALRNYLVTLLDGRALGDLLPEQFDGVLVDAPCSCEGNMRKDVFASFLS